MLSIDVATILNKFAFTISNTLKTRSRHTDGTTTLTPPDQAQDRRFSVLSAVKKPNTSFAGPTRDRTS